MEGYGHMLVVAVGVNSQQGIITSLITGAHKKKIAASGAPDGVHNARLYCTVAQRCTRHSLLWTQAEDKTLRFSILLSMKAALFLDSFYRPLRYIGHFRGALRCSV